MLSHFPKWIEYGAFILAFVAGCINTVGLLGFEHQSISHLSGTATLLGSSLLQSSPSMVLHLVAILFSFFVGAALTSILLHGSALQLGRHYDTVLLIEALLIFLSWFLLSEGSFYGHYTASIACGIQNAMATTYSGAIIRTTHLTGIFTDLGIMLGASLRGEPFDRRKGLLFVLIIFGFIIGCTFGAYTFDLFGFGALLAPACICIILAFLYRFYINSR